LAVNLSDCDNNKDEEMIWTEQRDIDANADDDDNIAYGENNKEEKTN